MPHSPESCTSGLDFHRIEYFHAVAEYAELAIHGADLTAVCEGAGYVQSPALALLVQTLSPSPGILPGADFVELARRLADDRRPVRIILRQLVARSCLMRDVLRCVAHYHDQDLARFWASRLAA